MKILIILIIIPAFVFSQSPVKVKNLWVDDSIKVGNTIACDSIRVQNLWLSEKTNFGGADSSIFKTNYRFDNDTANSINTGTITPWRWSFWNSKQKQMPFDTLSFNTYSPASANPGTVNYTDGIISVKSDITGVSMAVGEELWSRKVKNNTSGIINAGTVVRINGNVGGNMTIAKASYSTADSCSALLGVATHNIDVNGFGRVTLIGKVGNLNTSTFNAGDTLYLSHSGLLRKTKPTTGIPIRVGYVEYSNNNNGRIIICIDRLSDIRSTTATNLTGFLFGTGSLVRSSTASDTATNSLHGLMSSADHARLSNSLSGGGTSGRVPYYGPVATTLTNNSSFTFSSPTITLSNSVDGFQKYILCRNTSSGTGAVAQIVLGNNNYSSDFSTGAFAIRKYGANYSTTPIFAGSVGFMNYSNTPIWFGTSANPRMFLRADGNLQMIGTNSIQLGGTATTDDKTHSISSDNSKTLTIWPASDDANAIKIGNSIRTIFPLIANTSNGYLYKDDATKSDSIYAVRKWVQNRIDYAVNGKLNYVGTYDASVNQWPSTANIKKGDWWQIATGGTLGGVAVTTDNQIYALADAPGQTNSNWDIVGNTTTIPIARKAGDNSAGYIEYVGSATATQGKFYKYGYSLGFKGGVFIDSSLTARTIGASSNSVSGTMTINNNLNGGSAIIGTGSINGFGVIAIGNGTGTGLVAQIPSGASGMIARFQTTDGTNKGFIDANGKATFYGGVVSTGVTLDSNYVKINTNNSNFGYRGQYYIHSSAQAYNIGSYGQYKNKTGDNINIGYRGQYNAIGSGNLNIGNYGCEALTTGSGNINISNYGMMNATTASSNIVIGYNAGNKLFDKSQNIFISTGGNVSKHSDASIIRIDAYEDSVSTFISGDMGVDTLRINAQARIGKGDNYTGISKTGNFTLNGTAKVWNDVAIGEMKFPASGATIPTFTTGFAGSALLGAYYFQGTTANDICFFDLQISHDVSPSDSVRIHWHGSPTTTPTTTDTIVLQFNYTYAEIGSTFPAVTSVIVKIPLTGRSQWGHYTDNVYASATGTGLGLSGVYNCSIVRLQDNASDTYTGNYAMISIDCHAKINSLGSRFFNAK
jgi:hypothetical protein